jgi:hypothetical protein
MTKKCNIPEYWRLLERKREREKERAKRIVCVRERKRDELKRETKERER